MKRIIALTLLSLVLASCGTTTSPVSPITSSQVFLSKSATNDACGFWPASPVGTLLSDNGTIPVQTKNHEPIMVWGMGYFPVNCDSQRVVLDGVWYRVYFLLSDGRRVHLGDDHHPFTKPLDGPGPIDTGASGGHYTTNDGVIDRWTFVVSGPEPSVADSLVWYPSSSAHLIVELWGHGGKIAEAPPVLFRFD
jgi:hypothetical protein